MPDIRPFPALRYGPDADLARLSCPPYDVLSPAERQALVDRSPHAMVHLILPEGASDAKYENAARLLTDWQQAGVLREAASSGFYVSQTEFTEPGTTVRRHRLGLACLLRLHEYADKVVLPHEKTLDRPKEDRLKLLQATKTNLESIMTLVEDPNGRFYNALETATQEVPLADFSGDDAQQHRLWKIEANTPPAREIQEMVGAQPHAFIADGHHRYETSLTYAREKNALGSDRPEAFLLATLSSFADPGLSLLPTHRLVKGVSAADRASLFRHLEQFFDVHEMEREDLLSRLRLAVQNQAVFGLALGSGNLYQVSARDASALEAALPAGLDPSLRRLPVILLQHLVLEKALGIGVDEIATTDRLSYTRSADEALARVHAGEFDAALLLGRTPVEAVRDVSLAGQVMPQKSTFFYPKLLSGLVMRKL